MLGLALGVNFSWQGKKRLDMARSDKIREGQVDAKRRTKTKEKDSDKRHSLKTKQRQSLMPYVSFIVNLGPWPLVLGLCDLRSLVLS
jgi:hypothetical protein